MWYILFCEDLAHLCLLLGLVRRTVVSPEKNLEEDEFYGGNNCTELHKIYIRRIGAVALQPGVFLWPIKLK